MNKTNTILRTIAALSLAGSLAACEETLAPAPKPTPAVSPEPATPPPAATAPTPAPAPPEAQAKKDEQPADKDETASKPMGALGRARAALASGDNDEALKLAKIAVGASPTRSAAWNTLGRVQL